MKGRLLLVDDNEDFLDSTKDVLEEGHYHVTTATDGTDAVGLMKRDDFDLVLMDIKMPGLNGVEAFMKMKEQKPNIKAILFTAYSLPELVRKALEEGVQEVLHKPFDMARLLELLEEVRRNSEADCILSFKTNSHGAVVEGDRRGLPHKEKVSHAREGSSCLQKWYS